MFLRITRGRFDSAKSDQVTSLAPDVVTAAKKLPGLQSIYQASDASSGQAVIVSVWDSREHAQFDRSALGDVISRFQSMGGQLEAPELYEIDAQG